MPPGERLHAGDDGMREVQARIAMRYIKETPGEQSSEREQYGCQGDLQRDKAIAHIPVPNGEGRLALFHGEGQICIGAIEGRDYGAHQESHHGSAGGVQNQARVLVEMKLDGYTVR